MWKSTEYCNFSTTWGSNHDASYLTTYSFIQAEDEWCSDDERNEEEEDLQTSSSSYLRCFQQDEENPCCFELCMTCKPHHSVCILGAVIVSEARTIECYTETEGYVGSFQGSRVDNGFQTAEDGSQTLYRSVVKLEDAVPSLCLKFLSLNGKTEFIICQFKLILLHTDPSPTRNVPGSVDLSKVRGYLHSMGDSIPDSAMELLQSVEQYQKTQMTGLEQIQSMMSGLPPSTSGDNQLAGLLSVVSQLGPMPTTSGQNIPASEQKKTDSEHKSNNLGSGDLPDSESDLEPLQSLMRSISQVQDHQALHGGQGEGQGNFMYKMLQNICGKVSDMRLSTEAADPSSDDLVRESGISAESYDQMIVPDTKVSSESSSGMATISIDNIKSLLEQTVSQTLKSTEDRLMKYIDTRLAAVETTITNRIDKMVLELQTNGINGGQHVKHEQKETSTVTMVTDDDCHDNG